MVTRTPAEDAALHDAISIDRIGAFQAAATGGTSPLDLYVWDRNLAVAVLADIAILEVALRNAIHRELTKHHQTPEWYTLSIGLDDRTCAALTQAWNRVPKGNRTPGRVIARLMFGFWTGLLEAGG